MDTKNFNFIDKVVAAMRLAKVTKYVQKNDIILDFGCGSQGYFLKSVSDKIKRGIGLDYDVNDIEQDNLKFVKQKVTEKLPFESNTFNKIFLLAVLEHIPPKSVDKLFLEFNRVLKNNGSIVLTTPTPFGKKILEFLAHKLHLISEGEIRDHKKYYDREEITSLSKKSFFKLANYKLFQFGINSCAVLKKNN